MKNLRQEKENAILKEYERVPDLFKKKKENQNIGQKYKSLPNSLLALSYDNMLRECTRVQKNRKSLPSHVSYSAILSCFVLKI